MYHTQNKSIEIGPTPDFHKLAERCTDQTLPVIKLKHFPLQKGARKVIQHGYRNHHVGLFASRLNQMLVPFESALEKDACAYFESLSEITGYRSQPMAIQLTYGTGHHKVFPDFELHTSSCRILVDVRFENNASSDQYRERCKALQTYAEQRGMRYALFTEKEIRGQRLENSRLLLNYCHGVPEQSFVLLVFNWLKGLGSQTISEAFNKVREYPAVWTVIAGMILDGQIIIDWNEEIDRQPLTWAEGALE